MGSPELWSDIVEQLSLLYESTVPKLLRDEMKNFSNAEAPHILGEERPGVKAKKAQQPADSRQKFEQCYAKCTTQLQLTLLVSDVVAHYFEFLSISQIRALLQRLDS